MSGPFVNYTLNLGPVSLDMPGGTIATNPNNDTGIFSWNPRCLKRDLTDFINQNFANASNVLDVVLNNDDIASFQFLFQGVPGADMMGVHAGGTFPQQWNPSTLHNQLAAG